MLAACTCSFRPLLAAHSQSRAPVQGATVKPKTPKTVNKAVDPKTTTTYSPRMCASHMFAWLVLVTIARAEVFVTRFGQQLGNARHALYHSAFPYAIRHGCILRLADDIEQKELGTARAFSKYHFHDPSDQVVPLFERFFNFTQGKHQTQFKLTELIITDQEFSTLLCISGILCANNL